MRHERHYTLEQANGVRRWVAERVGWIRGAQEELAALGLDGVTSRRWCVMECGLVLRHLWREPSFPLRRWR